MMRNLVVPALSLFMALASCSAEMPVDDRAGDDDSGDGGRGTGGISAKGGAGGKVTGSGGVSGQGGTLGSGGVSASGGALGSGGVSGSGGALGSGGVSGSGGTLGSGGVSGSGGALGSGGVSGSGGAGMSTPDAKFFKQNCECPVLSGFSSKAFCDAYAEICGFTGANRYASPAACMAGFKGGQSDTDAKKAGALCCAYKMPDMKEAKCAAAK